MSLPSLTEFPAILLPLVNRARQSFCTALAAVSDEALAVPYTPLTLPPKAVRGRFTDLSDD
ncbi:hypothetical protein, partial [Pseudomonas syringae]|uniref:hypothetical protein n=1 Tax=Pseudomonas syringae TaxID=317 RepID=UPI001F474854